MDHRTQITCGVSISDNHLLKKIQIANCYIIIYVYLKAENEKKNKEVYQQKKYYFSNKANNMRNFFIKTQTKYTMHYN